MSQRYETVGNISYGFYKSRDGRLSVFTVDTWKLDLVRQYSWRLHNHGYFIACTKINGKRTNIYLHRLLMDFPATLVDHKNGDKTDNRMENLRVCDHSMNIGNSKRFKTSTSGYKGVTQNKKTGKWVAFICYRGHHWNIGTYATPLEAHEAYCEVANKLHGEFSRSE